MPRIFRRKSSPAFGLALMLASLFIAATPRFAAAQPVPPTTTIITHGFTTGDKGSWVQTMAEAILVRSGGGSIYRYTESTATWTYVLSAASDGTTNSIVCIFNWVPESDAPDNGPNWNYAQAAGDALYAALRDPIFASGPPAPPTTLPSSLVDNRYLHFIGHSRGACVISEAIIRFAREGIVVDHMTALDPHPVNGTLDSPLNFNWNDPTPRRWSNLTWADTYWRADGGGLNAFDFDGIPIDGAFNTNLSESALNCCGYSIAHSDVHLWLHGTIDLGPTPCDGEQCINATMRSTWWSEGFTQRGWFYSRLGGGSGLRPAVAAASNPPATSYVMGGDFNNASYAGWNYHGGSVGGSIVNEGGAQFLKIGAGVGSPAIARHNRLLVPIGATQMEFDTRVLTGANAAGESLRIALIDQGGASTTIADDPIGAAGGWNVDRRFTIPPGVVRNRTYSLSFQVVSNVGASAVVGIDNIDLVVQPRAPGDIDGDGCVNVADLLAVITSWGACPAAPVACPADTNASGTVDVADLLTVITHWGCV